MCLTLPKDSSDTALCVGFFDSMMSLSMWEATAAPLPGRVRIMGEMGGVNDGWNGGVMWVERWKGGVRMMSEIGGSVNYG